jgi:type I restriction enzyme, S subunit
LLTAWINRIEGQYQLNRWSVKTTVDHTSLEYINMIRVPRLEPDIEEEVANKLLAARLNRWFAIALTKAARVLVESLIESRFTEGEFVAAENGLKRGDHTLDRAILGQLTNEGVSASDGQRLFPNIDALYAAIGEAERAQTDGEPSWQTS